jgi:hypothetical protein
VEPHGGTRWPAAALVLVRRAATHGRRWFWREKLLRARLAEGLKCAHARRQRGSEMSVSLWRWRRTARLPAKASFGTSPWDNGAGVEAGGAGIFGSVSSAAAFVKPLRLSQSQGWSRSACACVWHSSCGVEAAGGALPKPHRLPRYVMVLRHYTLS